MTCGFDNWTGTEMSISFMIGWNGDSVPLVKIRERMSWPTIFSILKFNSVINLSIFLQRFIDFTKFTQMLDWSTKSLLFFSFHECRVHHFVLLQRPFGNLVHSQHELCSSCRCVLSNVKPSLSMQFEENWKLFAGQYLVVLCSLCFWTKFQSIFRLGKCLILLSATEMHLFN